MTGEEDYCALFFSVFPGLPVQNWGYCMFLCMFLCMFYFSGELCASSFCGLGFFGYVVQGLGFGIRG